VQEITPFTT